MSDIPVHLGQPFSLKGLLAGTLRQAGLREIARARNLWITGVAAVLTLVVSSTTGFPVVLLAILLLSGLPEILRDMRFEGPEGFRFRLEVTRRAGTVDLALLPDDSTQPVAHADFEDDDWRVPARFGRRGTAEFLAPLMELLARGFHTVGGEPFLFRLGGDDRRRARSFALLGNVARRFADRGVRIRQSVPVLPLPRFVQILGLAAVSGLAAAALRASPTVSAVVVGVVTVLLTQWIGLDDDEARLKARLGGRNWAVDPGTRSVGIERHHREHRVSFRTGDLFDENLAVVKPELLEEGIDRLFGLAAGK